MARDLRTQGHATIGPDDGVEALGRLIAQDRDRVGVLPFDLRQWFQAFPVVARSPFFARLRSRTGDREQVTGRDELRAELISIGPGPRRRVRLERHLGDRLRLVLRTNEAIDASVPMASLGVDSLMSLELRNLLEAELGIELPTTLVWAYPTLAELATELARRIGAPLDDERPAADEPAASVGRRNGGREDDPPSPPETSRAQDAGDDEILAEIFAGIEDPAPGTDDPEGENR
jgi:acyl carrier protein